MFGVEAIGKLACQVSVVPVAIRVRVTPALVQVAKSVDISTDKLFCAGGGARRLPAAILSPGGLVRPFRAGTPAIFLGGQCCRARGFFPGDNT